MLIGVVRRNLPDDEMLILRGEAAGFILKLFIKGTREPWRIPLERHHIEGLQQLLTEAVSLLENYDAAENN